MANAKARRSSGGMTDAELTSQLDGMITDAVSYDGSELSQLRMNALTFVDGDIDIPSEDGKSSVVSHDLADTLHWMMPGILRTFLASDNVAIYEPRKRGDEESAKQATDYINTIFMTENDGYKVLYGAFYDGMLSGNGIIKHWWDTTPQYSVENFSGLSDDQYNFLVAQDDVEKVLEHTEYSDSSFTFASANPNPALIASIAPPQPAVPPVPGAGIPPMGGGVPGGPGSPMAGPGGAGGLGGGPAGGIQGQPGGIGSPEGMGTLGNGGAGATGLINPLAALAGAAGPSLPPMGLPSPDMMPPMQPPMLHDCRIKRKTSDGRLQIKVLPPEEFLIERNATSLDEESVRFCGHRYTETRSNLIRSGYDPLKVKEIPNSDDLSMSNERMTRENVIINQSSETDESTSLVEVYECYILVDYDGDGIAEWRKVVMAGGSGTRNILANDEWGEELPFTDLVPEPVPHRWRGRALYDDVADIQRIKSVLMRQTLDNLYQTNNPMMEVIENQVLNLDALVNRELGANIFVRAPGTINPIGVPFTAKESFGMLSYLDDVLQKRTGVSGNGPSLDMDALQNQTATAVNAAQAAVYAKQETYARNIAEVGMKRLFRCILKLVVKHQDRPKTIRLRGQFVDMDPRAWDANMDLSINTGLGSGSRDKDMAMLNGIKTTQENILKLLGPNNPICSLQEYRNTLAKMCETSGVKQVDQFFKEITPQTMQQMMSQPKPPDPKLMVAQMKAQADAQKMQMQQQFEQQKLQMQAEHEAAKATAEFGLKQKEAEFNQQMELARSQRDAQAQEANLQKQAQIEQMQAQADIAVKQKEAEMKMMMEREKMAHQMELERQKFEFEKELKLMDHHLKASQASQMIVASPDAGMAP